MGGRRDGPGFQSFFCSRRALCVTSHLRPYFLTCERGVKALTSSTVPRGRLSASQKLIRRNYVFAVTSPYTGCPALLGPKGAAPALHPERGYLKQGDFEGRYEKRNASLDLQGSQLLRLVDAKGHQPEWPPPRQFDKQRSCGSCQMRHGG